jgi:hypothetical protein
MNDTTLKNDTRFEELCERTKTNGRNRGIGSDSQVKTLVDIIDSGYCGVLDLTPDKHGKGVDDAQYQAKLYWEDSGKAAVFDAKAGNQRKTASCLRTGIKTGSCTKWGVGEPITNVDKLLQIRKRLRANPALAGKLDDAFNTVIKYCRRQLKRNDLIGPDELEAMCYKAVPEQRTVEDIVAAMRKQAENLYKGKSKAGACNTPHMKAIIDATTKQLKAFVDARKKGEEPEGTE